MESHVVAFFKTPAFENYQWLAWWSVTSACNMPDNHEIITWSTKESRSLWHWKTVYRNDIPHLFFLKLITFQHPIIFLLMEIKVLDVIILLNIWREKQIFKMSVCLSLCLKYTLLVSLVFERRSMLFCFIEQFKSPCRKSIRLVLVSIWPEVKEPYFKVVIVSENKIKPTLPVNYKIISSLIYVKCQMSS